MVQRLGERGFRRIVRRVLFWKIAVPRSRSLHQEIAGLQNGPHQGAGFDFSRKRRPQRSVCAKLDVFPYTAVAWKSAGEICNFPWRAARPTETNASTAKARGGSRLVRQIFFQGRKAFQRSAERRLTAGSNVP